MVLFNIQVVMNPRPAVKANKRVRTELRKTEKAANSLGSSLRGLFAGIGASFIVRETTQIADSYTTLSNRLATVSESQDQVNQSMEDLFGIANKTRQGLEGVVSLYQRGSIAAKELGVSNEELLKFVDKVSQGLAVQGGAASESAGALTQLSQALGSGIVRAEEFNSILDGASTIAAAAARGIDRAGGSVSKLRALISKGKITSKQFFDGFLKGSDQISEKFGKTISTIEQAFVVMSNNATKFIGEQDKALGISKRLTDTIIFLAGNFETLARAAVAAGVALSVGFATKGVNAAIGGLRRLSVAILTNPITVVPALVAVAIGALVGFGDEIKVQAGSITTIADVASAAWATMSEAFAQAGDEIQAVGKEIFGEGFVINFRTVVEGAAIMSDAIVGLLLGAYNAVKLIWDRLPEDWDLVGELAQKAIRDIAEGTIKFLGAAFQTIGDLILNSASLGKQVIANYAAALGALSAGNTEAAASLVESAEFAAKAIVLQFKNIPGQVKKNFAALKAVDILPVVELSKGAEKLGEDVGKEFKRGFKESTGAQELVSGIFDRADDRSRDRGARDEEEERLRKAKEASQDLNNQGKQDATEFQKAWDGAFKKINDEAVDFTTVAGAALNSLADNATDSLVKFAETGKFAFKDFASSLLKDLTRIIARLLIVKALQAASGLGGAAAPLTDAALNTANSQGGRARGGQIQPGQRIKVGENGPETVDFNKTGVVNPASQAAPQVTVNTAVINQIDPAEFSEFVANEDSDDVFVNKMARLEPKLARIRGNR
jgi:tape measure domain-containing protein